MASRRARFKYRRKCARRQRDRRRRRSGNTVVDHRTLPPRPSSICRSCWRGLFAAQLGILAEPIRERDTVTPRSPAAHHRPPYSGGYAYSLTERTLRHRATRGCLWCRHLAELFDPSELTDRPLHIRVGRPPYSRYTPEGAQVVEIQYHVHDKKLGWLQALAYERHLGVYATADDPAAAYVVARPNLLDVGSERAFVLTKACIEECMRTHEHCRALTTFSRSIALPTRLIDCTDPNHPRLVHTDGARGAYLALSYVWGGEQPHRTTTENLSTYLSGIDIELLPATIRDAIHVTHSLRYQLLWIDSLCIIQNSKEDKHREMARMRNIYRNAALTIIAASASSVQEGFLQDCEEVPPSLTLPFICPAVPGQPKSKVGTIHLVAMDSPYPPDPEPVDKRAWCLQERLVSPRSLIFSSQTLQFRCQTTTVKVGGAIHDTALNSARLPDVLLQPEPPRVVCGSEAWWGVWRAWREAVLSYAGRKVSFASDKLVACAGLAEEFHRVLGSDYLAGLWRDSLLLDLLWIATYFAFDVHDKTPRRPPSYRAPSWSWAALDQQIGCSARHFVSPSIDFDALVELIDAGVLPADDTLPFGEVVGGSLVLCVTLCPCVRTGKGRVLVQPPLLQVPDSGGTANDGLAEQDTRIFASASFDERDKTEEAELWAIPILRWQPWGQFGDFIEGLLVTADKGHAHREAKTERGIPVYRRVGYFDLSNDVDRWEAFTRLPSTEVELV
ncbi:heterokaryon incompatibility protein-domain-containing protein [Trametes polyzona]|nr:heterokaryon incompatibility protein-domain-containing protein [Trametes polyzona]